MFEYIILGILQGIFEWIPVSSEGIVALFSNYFIKDLNAIDVAIFLHLGTLLAVLIYFWKDWLDLLKFKDLQFFKFFIITTIISGAIGFFLYDFSKEIVMGGGLLALMGAGLLLTSYFQKKKIDFKLNENYSPYIVGILQGFSVIPGVSRSGSTIFGLSLFENDPLKVLKTSYLLSAPVVFGSNLYLYLKNPDIVSQNGIIALVFAFIFGILTLKLLLNLVKKINFSSFTFAFGILCILSAIIEYLI
ncbi:MAG: undecaprenyl-diphosphate phosphatase [Candidatus Pacebacteria bacterium]|nr:undecaprenyl-diphosphate phosphatase [Candidatus Paceibacterota bacterium]